jgi:hypothetical protein
MKLMDKTPRALDNVWRLRIEVVGRDLDNTGAGLERGNVKAMTIVLRKEEEIVSIRSNPRR